jgi:dienelactone hydrolase
MSKAWTEELAYVETEDGFILAGLAVHPAAEPVKPVAIVWIPGLSINFYHPSFVPICREFASLGYTNIIGNTRGHDLGCNLWRKIDGGASMERRSGGALWERFEESPRDVAAWIDFAENLGFARVVLLGHSFGAPKVLYYQANRQDPRLAGLVLASTSSTNRTPKNSDLEARAEQMAAEGRGEQLLPHGSLDAYFMDTLSAQTYLSWVKMPDLYGLTTPEPEIARIRCPLLVCFGTAEDLGFDPSDVIEHLRRKAVSAASFDSILFEGANHGYDNHEREVAGAIARWVEARQTAAV